MKIICVKIISARSVYMYSKTYGTWIDSQYRQITLKDLCKNLQGNSSERRLSTIEMSVLPCVTDQLYPIKYMFGG